MQEIFSSNQKKDFYGGCLVFLLGFGAVCMGWTYQIGTLSHMGPGFFPVAVGMILALTGVAIVIKAKVEAPQQAMKQDRPEWRAWILIVLSISAFIVLGTYGGLLPATFAIVFISALADRQNTVRSAIVLALSIVTVSALIFRWALQVQLPLFRWR